MNKSRSVLFRIRNASEQIFTEYQNRNFMFNIFLFRKNAIYEIIRKNIERPGRPQMTIWRMLILCCKSNAKDKHSEYVIIIAFPLQQ